MAIGIYLKKNNNNIPLSISMNSHLYTLLLSFYIRSRMHTNKPCRQSSTFFPSSCSPLGGQVLSHLLHHCVLESCTQTHKKIPFSSLQNKTKLLFILTRHISCSYCSVPSTVWGTGHWPCTSCYCLHPTAVISRNFNWTCCWMKALEQCVK